MRRFTVREVFTNQNYFGDAEIGARHTLPPQKKIELHSTNRRVLVI